MPPGPPVLQSVVAEVYGPTGEERRKVAADLTKMFEKAKYIDDVDNLMQARYDIWQFKVNRDKALRAGVTVDTINKTLEMSMGGYRLGDIKDGSILEPTMIILQLPIDIRSDFANLTQLPIPTQSGMSIPLSELGSFTKSIQDPIIYHKDLRPVEFVTGETVGALASPIYGMLEVEAMLDNYKGPRGEKVVGEMFGTPEKSNVSAFEWGGEWTVTYETFRDMGMAFGIAVILIYMLVVWEFGNFTLPAIIISPIPLTLVGIIPGHWLMDADFTATSMIGFIALAGIIVRNSILLVDYTREQILSGIDAEEAIVMACITRTRPIIITALALVVGSTAILFDPIFQGMAISLMFGVIISTLLTLIVIPLGCSSGRKVFYPEDPNNYSQKTTPEKSRSGQGFFSSSLQILGKVLFFIYSVVSVIVSWLIIIFQMVMNLFFKNKKQENKEPKTKVNTTVSKTQASDKKSSVNSRTQAKSNSSEKDSAAKHDKKIVASTNDSKVVESIPVVEKLTVENSVVDNSVDKTEPIKKPVAKKKAPTKKKAVAKKTVTKKSTTKKSSTKKATAKKKSATKATSSSSSSSEKTSSKKTRRGISLKGDL
jgi:cytoskeletal protein RodZ